jgi:hypothetical protein
MIFQRRAAGVVTLEMEWIVVAFGDGEDAPER